MSWSAVYHDDDGAFNSQDVCIVVFLEKALQNNLSCLVIVPVVEMQCARSTTLKSGCESKVVTT